MTDYSTQRSKQLYPAARMLSSSSLLGPFLIGVRCVQFAMREQAGFESFVDEHLAASPAGEPLPFFAYVAFHNVHLPLEAPPQYLEQYLLRPMLV